MTDAVAPIESVLGPDAARAWWRRPSLWAALAAVLLALLAAWLWQKQKEADARPRYATEAVTRGRLLVTVTANGTLQPTNKVDIGSELSGTVARVLVDFNDQVVPGQLLAELDTAKLKDQVSRSEAAVAEAQARLQQAKATRLETQGNWDRLREAARLSGGLVPSKTDLASAEAAAARAVADEASAQAGVADSLAALSVDRTNLRKASIRSPIRGVVLSRSVDPGNAVAASLQAVTLFTIAEDLSQMKLAVNVDEADVGQVHAGQSARFTVSAYPDRNYPAKVTRVSYGSTTQNNVVTYIAELSVANADLSLRPGMTATAVIETDSRDDVMLVPNAALRFTPSASAGSASGGGIVSRLVPRGPPSTTVRRAGTRTSAVRQVWVLKEGEPVSVPVSPGASDGRTTEVTSPVLKPGMAVIVEQTAGSAK